MEQPDYLDHFRLRKAPFSAAPDAALFYAQGARRELLGALAYAVTHGDGIVKITGDSGSGMTLLCHALASELSGQAIVIHMEPASLGPLGVIHATAVALGLDPDGKRSDEVLRELQSRLTAMRAGGRHAVLMADHADRLPPAALEEIRLLTNLDNADGKLVQIVLLGQHALNASLRQSAMRQFRERITLSFVMPHLEPDEAPALLAHRLRAAGYEGLDMFASDAAGLLAATAKGDLRRLVHLAHLSLAAAASEGAVSVAMRHVQAAIRGRLPALKPRGMVRPVVAGSIAVIAALGIGAAVTVQQAQRRPAAASLSMHTGVIKSAAPMALDKTGAVSEAPGAAAAADDAPGGAAGATPPGVAAIRVPGAGVGDAPSTAATTGAPLGAAGVAPPGVAAARAPGSGVGNLPSTAAANAGNAAASAAAPTVAPSGASGASANKAGAAYAAGLAGSRAGAATASASASATAARAETDSQPPSASLLQQTLKAGKTWLHDEPDSHYSIKIEDFPVKDQARAEAFLDDVRSAIGLGDVHAYPTLNKGEHRIGIAYGSFATEQQARKALAALPARWGYAPKIRNVGAIRAAVARAAHAQARALQ
jgi:MSHA biogenesis protein MshM